MNTQVFTIRFDTEREYNQYIDKMSCYTDKITVEYKGVDDGYISVELDDDIYDEFYYDFMLSDLDD